MIAATSILFAMVLLVATDSTGGDSETRSDRDIPATGGRNECKRAFGGNVRWSATGTAGDRCRED